MKININIALAIIIMINILTGCQNDIINKDIISDTPINVNATENTKKLMKYLADGYGEFVLSGQYINTFDDFSKEKFLTDANDEKSWNVFLCDELKAVNSVTQDYPIVLGLDVALIPLENDQATVDFAKQWHEAGGIVTMCWHWFAPNREGEKQAFYSKDTDFDLKKVLANPQGEDYKALIKDIDTLSEALKPLMEMDVPILWRPLHEASGKWFWWGDSGKDSYRVLYDLLYERMTNVHGLNNLIWVANAQNESWYVGDDKCDILADDPYYDENSRTDYEKNPANIKRFIKMYNTTDKKIIAMSENEYLPNIDVMFENDVYWIMFATWCREFVCIMDENEQTTPVYSEKYATKEEVSKVYLNERVITMNKKTDIY